MKACAVSSLTLLLASEILFSSLSLETKVPIASKPIQSPLKESYSLIPLTLIKVTIRRIKKKRINAIRKMKSSMFLISVYYPSKTMNNKMLSKHYLANKLLINKRSVLKASNQELKMFRTKYLVYCLANTNQ